MKPPPKPGSHPPEPESPTPEAQLTRAQRQREAMEEGERQRAADRQRLLASRAIVEQKRAAQAAEAEELRLLRSQQAGQQREAQKAAEPPPAPPPPPEQPKRGRPKGSTAATRKAKLTVTLDRDLVDWAKAQGNASETIDRALRLLRSASV